MWTTLLNDLNGVFGSNNTYGNTDIVLDAGNRKILGDMVGSVFTQSQVDGFNTVSDANKILNPQGLHAYMGKNGILDLVSMDELSKDGALSGLMSSLGKIGDIGSKIGGFAQGIGGLFDSYNNYKAMKDNLKTAQLQRDVMQHNLDMSKQEYARLNNQRRQYTNAYLGR